MAIARLLDIGTEAAAALAEQRPVVALESTIITHGMPYPQNLEMASKVEAIIRNGGAVPATVSIMDGQFQVGLDAADLERLAKTGMAAAKASRRDVAALLSTGGIAGTTVATTMQAAEMAGIRIFATGGIGGVHRGAERSFIDQPAARGIEQDRARPHFSNPLGAQETFGFVVQQQMQADHMAFGQ